jgi:hypothetical protein
MLPTQAPLASLSLPLLLSHEERARDDQRRERRWRRREHSRRVWEGEEEGRGEDKVVLNFQIGP